MDLSLSLTPEQLKEQLKIMTDKVINFEKDTKYEEPKSLLFEHKKRLVGKDIKYGKKG